MACLRRPAQNSTEFFAILPFSWYTAHGFIHRILHKNENSHNGTTEQREKCLLSRSEIQKRDERREQKVSLDLHALHLTIAIRRSDIFLQTTRENRQITGMEFPPKETARQLTSFILRLISTSFVTRLALYT